MGLPLRVAWWVLLGLLWSSAAQAQPCPEASLHTEFITDPTTRNYLSCSTNGDLTDAITTSDQCVLDLFNATCTNNAACTQDQTVSRETIWETIDPTELETLMRSTAANDVARKNTLNVAMLSGTFDLSKSSVRQKFTNIFPGPNSPITNAGIAALQQKNVPRSQVVCHRPGTLSDVACGLRGACP